MKGIEGLPLKYILIVLVAALVIVAILGIMTTVTKQATTSAEKTTNETTSAVNLQLCKVRENSGVCDTGTCDLKTGTTDTYCCTKGPSGPSQKEFC